MVNFADIKRAEREMRDEWEHKFMTDGSDIRKFAGLEIVQHVKQNGLCLMMYGMGGAGKTSTLANIVKSPHGKPALLVDAEGGSSSVTHLIKEGLDIIHVTSWAEIEKIRAALKRDHTYKTIIWDNLSEMARLCLNHIAGQGNMPQIQHYGLLTARITEFVAEYRNMANEDGINALFVAWEETEKDSLTEMVRKKLNLTPKLSAALPGMVTMVGRLTVVGGRRDNYIRKLSFAPSEDTDSKFRVAPTDAAAKIPLELYVRQEDNVLADFLATVYDGTTFPVSKYAPPQRGNTNATSAN